MTRLRAAMAVVAVAMLGLLGLPGSAFSAAPETGAALGHWAALQQRLGLGHDQRLVLRDEIADPDGTRHLRFDRTWRGLPVIAGDLVVHLAADDRILGVDRASEADLDALGAPGAPDQRVSAGAARSLATRRTGLAADGTRPVVYAAGGVARLAFEAVTAGSRRGPERVAVYVDATTGRELESWSLVPRADGVGKSLYGGKVALSTTRSAGRYRLADAERGGQRVYDAGGTSTLGGVLFSDADNVWGNYRTTSRQSAAVDAAYGSAVVWDFLRTRLGRDGLRDDGVGARGVVHYGSSLENAYWLEDCFCVVYGDGGASFSPLVSLDVVGHEMAHGLTNATAGLVYLGESGALSEASSDILGTAVEFFAANPEDPGDYLIGEEITRSGLGYLRRMDRPSRDGMSSDCWSPTLGAGDVHDAAGPANHFFYLLAEGSGARVIGGVRYNSPTCDGGAVSRIGRTKALRIWYRALSVHLTSTSGYREARDATIRAARSLYGSDSAECRSVEQAWDAVAVPEAGYTCAAKSPSGGENAVVNGGFEQGPAAWTATAAVITSNPRYFGAYSGEWYAFLNSYGTERVDQVSQPVQVPDEETVSLRFQLAIFSLDSSTEVHDTFTVSVVDGGVRTPLLTLDNTDAAWSYAPHVVDLSAYAGRPVTLEFTGREDASAMSSFLLDDVSVTPR